MAGHSATMTENIAESRSRPCSPKACDGDQWRRTPSKCAPRPSGHPAANRAATAFWYQTALIWVGLLQSVPQNAEKRELAERAGNGAQAGGAFLFEIVRWVGFVGAVEDAHLA